MSIRDDPRNGGRGGPPAQRVLAPRVAGIGPEAPGAAASSPRVDLRRLVRRNTWLALCVAIVGAVVGFIAVIFTTPVYRSQGVLEVQGVNESLLKGAATANVFAVDDVNIQTQIQLLQTGSFLQRVAERMNLDTVPPLPAHNDFFSKVRARVRERTSDPIGIMKAGLQMATLSFRARPINRTRLIELTCNSIHPELAANFINTLANEYITQGIAAHSQGTQRTSSWLTSQVEEAKTRLKEAEDRLQEFIRNSGNLFVPSQDNTLADSKLRQLQGELSAIQADRIAKQAKFEMAIKSSQEALPDVLDDETLRGYRTRITELRREHASMGTTFTPSYYRMKSIDIQIGELQQAMGAEIHLSLEKARKDYEAALRRENLLAAAYSNQSKQVGAQAGKAADYDSLRREVEVLRQAYGSMLVQLNQVAVASSAAINPLRLADPGAPSQEPYKPNPVIYIGFGGIAGLFLSAGIAYAREQADRSFRAPGQASRWLSSPELGVIPSIEPSIEATTESARRLLVRFRWMREVDGNGVPAYSDGLPNPSLAAWHGGQTHLAESFRATLTSLLREREDGLRVRVILVTSPGSGEGKTTFVANIGVALAEAGRKVLLVDADLRNPRLHEIFALSREPGLSTAIEDANGKVPALDASMPLPGLAVLPSGPAVKGISRLLHSPRVDELISSLREQFDLIVIDAPPLLLFADARMLLRVVDGVVLVLRSGVTDRQNAVEAQQCLREDGAQLLGTILNDWKPDRSDLRSRYNRYYTEQAATPNAPPR